MKVELHVISGLNRGGAQRQLFFLCRSSINKPVVVSLTNGDEILDLFKKNGITVLYSKFPFLLSPLYIVYLCLTLKPTFLMAWMYHSAFVTVLVKFLCPQIKLIWNIRHSLSSLHYEKRATQLVILFIKFFSFLPFCTVYNSCKSMRQHHAISFSKRRSIVIPNGIDTSLFTPFNKAPKDILKRLPRDLSAITVLGHVARYTPMKNHRGILDALRILHQSDLPFFMIFIGSKVDAGEFYNLASSCEFSSKILLLPDSSEIHMYYPLFDLLLLPSLWGEAFPNVVGEAMSSGVPVLASDIGDISSIIGNEGFIFPPSQPLLFQKFLTQIVSDPKILLSLKASARTRIVNQYSVNRMIASYSKILGWT